MHTRRSSRIVGWAAAGAAGPAPASIGATTAASATTPDPLRPGTELYVPPPDPGALDQIALLRAAGDREAARRIRRMIRTPQAAWFTEGTPREVRRAVRDTVRAAAARGTVPVLVAYFLPFRDCAQYSAGGATSTEEYVAWIDGFARGIGNKRAIVILEPDGLGIIPWYTSITGAQEWCRPEGGSPALAEARFRELNAAVDRLAEQPRVRTYLDGTHSAWLGVGDAADRLVKAGVQRAAGFFLNVSNYQLTDRQVKYGTWISKCIAYGTSAATLGRFDACASQYFPASPDDVSTWGLSDAWYDANLGDAQPTARFVVDTSRNGRGPWAPEPGEYTGDPQVWCNPPERGLGLRPTTDTGVPLLDAYLWIKVPGESDGQCNRSVPGSTTDPEWGGIEDPAAGDWFAQQALELTELALPPLD